nr:eukaryotic initiation factor 4A-15-like [Tanacetum cinerariifolium]
MVAIVVGLVGGGRVESVMVGVAAEGSQFDTHQFDSKMDELLSADGQDFFTLYDEVTKTFDAMGLLENLLRGIYAYGDNGKWPVIIAKDLSSNEKTALINVLKTRKKAIACPWVSPIHCVPKKGGMTVIKNDENELVPTRLVTGWRVCIDYRKLNEATRKSFPTSFHGSDVRTSSGE